LRSHHGHPSRPHRFVLPDNQRTKVPELAVKGERSESRSDAVGALDGQVGDLTITPAGRTKPRTTDSGEAVVEKKWFTVAEVAEMLGYGQTKVRMLVIQGDLRSLKDGRSRRILPEWVDEYVQRRAEEAAA
jgi:excisionase family DNA binding protein